MAMTSLDIPRDADTGDAIEFTASFRKVTLVETKKGVIKTSTVKTSFKKQPISKNEKGTPGTESTPMQDWFTTIIDSAKKSLGMSK